MQRSFIRFVVLLLPVIVLTAVTTRAQLSSDLVYDSIQVRSVAPGLEKQERNLNSMGVNILISTNGFGLGTFFRHEYSEDFAGFIDLSISEAKDDQEVEFINPYTGQSYIPGKVNRFLMFPLIFGVEHRLFREDIVDNFRPYINGGIGPTMIYTFPYVDDYFSALGKGQPKYTGAGYIGLGAYFGTEESNVLGLNIRYYYIPYPSGLESFRNGEDVKTKNQFGGFYITLHFGSSW